MMVQDDATPVEGPYRITGKGVHGQLKTLRLGMTLSEHDIL